MPNSLSRRFFMTLFVVTMFFGGGLIPTYLLVKQLGMLNTVWAVIIPGAVNVWNIILSRTFFKGVPNELKEAANVDGASEAEDLFPDRAAVVQTDHFCAGVVCFRRTMEFVF